MILKYTSSLHDSVRDWIFPVWLLRISIQIPHVYKSTKKFFLKKETVDWFHPFTFCIFPFFSLIFYLFIAFFSHFFFFIINASVLIHSTCLSLDRLHLSLSVNANTGHIMCKCSSFRLPKITKFFFGRIWRILIAFINQKNRIPFHLLSIAPK